MLLCIIVSYGYYEAPSKDCFELHFVELDGDCTFLHSKHVQFRFSQGGEIAASIQQLFCFVYHKMYIYLKKKISQLLSCFVAWEPQKAAFWDGSQLIWCNNYIPEEY